MCLKLDIGLVNRLLRGVHPRRRVSELSAGTATHTMGGAPAVMGGRRVPAQLFAISAAFCQP
jgi:hypothetical protein